MASTAAPSAYPLPPPHWRLFRPDCQVRILPPRPPPEGAPVFVFGQPHSLQPAAEGLDKDDELCDVDGDLRGQLLRLHRMLQSCVHDLVHSAIEEPSENARHLRHYNTIMRNLITLLDVARKREASLVVLDRLRDQIARKDVYISHAAAILPGLQAEVSRILGLEAVPQAAEPPPPLTPVEPLVTATVAEALRAVSEEASTVVQPTEREADQSQAATAGSVSIPKTNARAASVMSSSSNPGGPAVSKLAADAHVGLPDAQPTTSAKTEKLKVSSAQLASVANSDAAVPADHPQGGGARPGKRRRLTIKRG
mmetsp:Transcript_126870/g.224871  ORF Transcript_126870/g.224871 Transcript_126870/m.224871 type:complete len:310 (+) Transcript_126870:119-1048(+)